MRKQARDIKSWGLGWGHSGDDTVLYRVFAPSHIERLAFKLNLKESAEA